MLKALRRASSSSSLGGLTGLGGLRSSQTAVLDADEEETGTWHYLVTDSEGIRPRREPSYTRDTKCSHLPRVLEGTLVEVTARRRAGWTRWLRLASGEGWVFDVSPKDNKVRMVEAEVLRGQWQYQASLEPVPILQKPSLLLAQKLMLVTGAVAVDPHEVVSVNMRIRPVTGRGVFLVLADGRGCVFDFFQGRQVMHRIDPGTEDPSGPRQLVPDLTAPLAGGELIGPAEQGEWNYIVLDPRGFTLRSAPTYDSQAKLQSRLEEGEVVKVVERRVGGGTTFLRLTHPQGWAFDVQPGVSNKRQRMAEVTVELGQWFYRVCVPKGIAFRSRCSFADDAKVATGPCEGAILTVTRRVRVGDTTFLRVKDDSNGWVFDWKNGRRMVEGPLKMEAHEDATATILPSEGVNLRKAPTMQSWASTSLLLLQNARVQVNLIGEVEGVTWAHISQRGKMEGWTPLTGLTVEKAEAWATPSVGRRFDAEQVRRALTAPSPLAT